MGISNQDHRTGVRGAFSLVELLVVIGIIALLIAMLLPTLARAREQANTVICLNNLRQIGLAMTFYEVNSKGWYPAAITPSLSGSLVTWDAKLLPLMSGSERSFLCPTDQVQRPGSLPRSYSLNDRMWMPPDQKIDLKRTLIERPTETICLSEHFVSNNVLRFAAMTTVRDPIGGIERANFYFHNGLRMSNVLWFDAHASSMRPSDLLPQKEYGNVESEGLTTLDWPDYRWNK